MINKTVLVSIKKVSEPAKLEKSSDAKLRVLMMKEVSRAIEEAGANYIS